jgi:hypothetical protein
MTGLVERLGEELSGHAGDSSSICSAPASRDDLSVLERQ